MASARVRTRLTLFVPGAPVGVDAWARALDTRGWSLRGEELAGVGLGFTTHCGWEPNPRDGSFGRAFSFGTATDAEQRAIDASPGALVLSFPVDLRRERAAIASVVRALAACGALAVRVEQSKLGYPVARWLDLVEGDDFWALYRTAVVVLGGGGEVATCGMHVFSLPDSQVAVDPTTDETAANALLGVLNVYQLVEDPLLLSGQTFSPGAETPRRVVRRWPDANYPPDHPCHNPFGVWRLGPPGGTAEPSRSVALVFTPALVAVLTALEEKEGRPLTREQVEEITSNAPCMAMEHGDAQRMERLRGYADLDPELIWDQWQIARRRE